MGEEAWRACGGGGRRPQVISFPGGCFWRLCGTGRGRGPALSGSGGWIPSGGTRDDEGLHRNAEIIGFFSFLYF